jgi:hypothetical protein
MTGQEGTVGKIKKIVIKVQYLGSVSLPEALEKNRFELSVL